MSQILGIKFSDHGPVCYFASGEHELGVGQHVLVETDQGQALGRVATVSVSPVSSLCGTSEQDAAAPAPAPFEVSLGVAEWEGQPCEAAVLDAPCAARPEGAVRLPEASAFDGEGAPAPSPVALFASDQAPAQPVPRTSQGLERILRPATEADLDIQGENRRLARRAFSFCRGCISSQNLDMKLVDVEVLHDRSKMIFFFTAPSRIDFRELIKSLVREFHTRIELRQIGVRHETQMIGAIGNCGQVCCCRRFLRKFAPVTIKMAKEQNLFLNPAKISGICGRLLCCLSYEQKGYEEFHKQCPKIGKRVQTPLGSVKVLRANFFKKSISVWVEDAGEREFTLEEWREMLARQPADAAVEAKAEPKGAARGEPRTETASDGAGRAPAGRPGRTTGRVSTGRPARTERPPRIDKDDRPPKAEAAQDAGAGPRAEAAEGEARERSRPRRKRRKSKSGPKPQQ